MMSKAGLPGTAQTMTGWEQTWCPRPREEVGPGLRPQPPLLGWALQLLFSETWMITAPFSMLLRLHQDCLLLLS